jgi:gliding motility-associated-like protein
MKKILFLTTFLFSLSIVNAQIFFSEDFEGGSDANGLPVSGGWGETGFSTDDFYMIGDEFDANLAGFWPVPFHTLFLQSNDDVCDCDKSEDRIILPVQDFSAITGGIRMTADVYWDDVYGGEVTLEVSTDGGITWNVVANVSSFAGNWQDGTTFDLSAFAGQSNVLISFLYNDMGQWGNGFALDNVILEETTVNFSADILTGSTCDTYTFTDLSPAGSTWDWDFGPDATPSTINGQGPHAVTFSTTGLKTISLTVDGTDTETKTDYIDVQPIFVTVDPVADQVKCAGTLTDDINFTGFGSGSETYDWTYTTSPVGENIGIASSGSGDILAFLAQNATLAQIVATFTVAPNEGGCAGFSETFTITVDPQDDANFSYATTAFCVGSADEPLATPAVVNGSFSSTTFGFVNFFDGTLAISSFPANTYDVTYTTNGACPNSSTLSIDINQQGDATFSFSVPSECYNGANPTTTISGDAGGVFSSTMGIAIDTNSGQISLATSFPGTYTIGYAVGAGVCAANSTQDFEIINVPLVAPFSDIDVCDGIIIPAFDLTPMSNFTVQWLNDNISTGVPDTMGTANIPSFTATNTPAGSALNVSNMKLYATNNGCTSDTVFFAINVNSNPIVNAGSPIVMCEGPEITMTATGSAGATFVWDNSITQSTPFTPVAGNYIYSVTATLNNCSAIDQVAVTVNVTPTVSAGVDRIVCENSFVTLTGSGASILIWNNGVSDNTPFLPTASGEYIVNGQNSFGCSDADTMQLTFEPLPTPSFTSNVNSGCSPTVVVFNSNATTNSCLYTFSDGTSEIGCTNISHTFTNVGQYDVTLTQVSINQCIGSVTVPSAIVINPDPVASFVVDRSIVNMIDPVAYFVNTSTGALDYDWDFGDASGVVIDENPFHSFPADAAGDYTVRLIAISQFGCMDTAYTQIKVEESLMFYIPNSFTPNGDEFNNKFQPVFYSGIDPQNFNMKIFNRFGQLIFESNDASLGWDGDYGSGNGLVETGVYTFKIEFSTSTKDEKKLVVGNVNVIR